MESGEREIMKTFEDTIRMNVETVVSYTTETRTQVRLLRDEVMELKNMLAQREIDISQLRTSIATIQSKLYNKGTA